MPQKTTIKTSVTDRDGMWKAMLEDLLKDILLLAIPESTDIFDFSVPVEFYSTELAQLFPGRKKEKGGRVDLLVKVKRKDGKSEYILLHIEVQSQSRKDFAKRMFRYYYRLVDKYDLPVTCLAIYADHDPNFCPDGYLLDSAGTINDFRFNVYKILTQDEEKLKISKNPFAIVVRIVQLALKKGINPDEVLIELGVELAKELDRSAFSKRRKAVLLWFLTNYVSFANSENLPKFEKAVNSAISKRSTMGVIEYIKEQHGKQVAEQVEHATKAEIVQSLLVKTKLSLREIADSVGVSIAFVRRVKKRLTSE